MADPERVLVIQLNLAEDAIRERFEEVVAYLRERNKLADVEAALERGDVEGALREIDRAAAMLAETTALAYVASGQATAGVIESLAPRGASVTFDVTNERAIRHLRETRLDQIRGFTEIQRAATREALIAGTTRGLNPRDQARMFRDSIGLTDYQVRIVNNYRRALESGDVGNALARELRDRRNDPRIRRLGEAPLTAKEIDARVEAYRQRWIAFRAETIARTESLRSVHAGADESWIQAVEDGDVDPADIVSTWNTSGGTNRRGKPRTRPHHRSMGGQERGFMEPFLDGHGNQLRYPCDPNAPVETTANCRCRKITRLRSAQN